MASQADSLALLDSLAYVYAINVVAKTIVGEEDMNAKVKGKVPWRDGVQVESDVEYTIFVATGDLETLLDDDLEISFIQYVIPLSVEGYESGQWFWGDAVSLDSIRSEGAFDSLSEVDLFKAVVGYHVVNP